MRDRDDSSARPLARAAWHATLTPRVLRTRAACCRELQRHLKNQDRIFQPVFLRLGQWCALRLCHRSSDVRASQRLRPGTW